MKLDPRDLEISTFRCGVPVCGCEQVEILHKPTGCVVKGGTDEHKIQGHRLREKLMKELTLKVATMLAEKLFPKQEKIDGVLDVDALDHGMRAVKHEDGDDFSLSKYYKKEKS